MNNAIHTHLPPLGLGCLLLASLPVHAEPTSTTLGSVEVVAATRSAGTVDDSPRAISVVSHATLEERPGMAGIQSALAEVPGIQFARSGGLGGQLVMRGFNSNNSRSIITVDGDRYRGRSTLEFNMFDPNGIERIEVLRGPASALYGADAMNGVVNIVTRRAKVDPDQPFTLSPRLRALEWNSGNSLIGGRVELSGGGQGFDVMIGAHHRSAQDYHTPLGEAKNSDYKMQGLDFAIGFRPGADSRWELSGRYERVETGRAGGLGAAPGAPLQEVSERPILERYLRLGYQGRNFGIWADKVDASLYTRDFETDILQYNRTNAAVTAYTHTRVYTPTVWGGHLIAMKGLGEHLLSYGADFFSEDFAGRVVRTTRTQTATGALMSDTGWAQADRRSVQTNLGVFITDEWQASDRLSLSGALRGDVVKVRIGGAIPGETASQQAAFGANPGNTRTAFTGNVGAVYKLDPVWSVAANLSRGFRAPSGTELTITSVAGTLTTLPSPDLEPEYNKTVELGLRWASDTQRGSLTAYRSVYTDLITTAVVNANLRQRMNVAEATITGIELEGQAALARNWRLGYSLTALRGEDDSTGRPLPTIAPLSARLSLRYQPSDWHVEGIWRGYKGKTRIDATQERTGAGYGMVDVYAGLPLQHVAGDSWKGWKLVAGVENLFNQVGRNPTVAENLSYAWGTIGNPLVEPGRAVVVKLTSDF